MRKVIKESVDKIRDLWDRVSRRSEIEASWNRGDFPGGFPAQWENQGNDAALRITTFFACVRIIAGSIASIPFDLVQEDDNGKKKYLIDEPEYWALGDYPNDETTSAEFMEHLVASLLMQGNAYEYTPRDGKGRPKAAWNLENDRVQPIRHREDLYYSVSRTDGVETPYKLYQGYDMWHVKRFNYGDGLEGMSVLTAHAPYLHIAKSQRDYQKSLYDNGMNFSGVVETDQDLESREIRKIERDLEKRYKGAKNAGRPLVLAHNLKYNKMSMTPEDAQMIENFNFTERDICKIFGVPLHMVANLERGTFSNIEHQQKEFVLNTLRSWCVFIERSARHNVLNQQQRNKGWKYRFELDELTRGVMNDRFAAWNVGVQGGFIAPNEARIAEGYEPMEGLDKPLSPLNMQSAAERASAASPNQKGQQADQAKGVDNNSLKKAAKDGAKKALKKEASNAQRSAAEEALIKLVEEAATRSATKIAGIQERGELDVKRACEQVKTELFRAAIIAARGFDREVEEERVSHWASVCAPRLVFGPDQAGVEAVVKGFGYNFVKEGEEEDA